MKYLFIFSLVMCATLQNSKSQPLIQQAEILFRNSTSHDIILEVSPASSIFSGFYNVNIEPFRKFTLRRSNPAQIPFWPLMKNDTAYLVGGRKKIGPGDYALVDFDDGMYYDLDSASKILGGISYGLWKFSVFFYDSSENQTNLIEDFFYDERDINHGQLPLDMVDIFFTLVRRSEAVSDSIVFISSGAEDTVNLYDSRIENKLIKSWHKVGYYHPIYGQDPIKPGSPNKGNFKTISNERKIPIYGTEFGGLDHINAGSIDMNLLIEHDLSTRDTLIDLPTNIVVTHGAALKLNNSRILDIISPSNSGTNVYNNLIVQDSSFLILYGYSKIILHQPNKLILQYGSNLTLGNSSEIIIMNGAKFCNEGGYIRGPGHIIFEKGIHNTCEFDNFTARDSMRIVLDSATLTLPDNLTMHLTGKETALILNSGSKLLFGEKSGIVCDSGARLIANYATFASVDSTKKWNGISLNDPSHDTIKNCTIKNAMYGIALSGKYDPDESPEPYSSEISGCSFINQTSYVLNNALYLDNSAHVLVKDNTVSSANLSIGFTHGIYAEYCPGEMLNIINNNISNCNNGMTVIQSSPYIAFNTLNGNSYGESGMFLDNSNGTIKYNVISDFYNSYYSFYSSPDLLKNTFDNSCDDNVYLSSSSVPVMHPLQSGGSVYWYAGDNLITGSPSDAGILFDSDAMPDLNYGYNRFVLQGSSYYINGANPTGGTRDFYAVKNYWHDNPPDSSKFNVANAESVIFNPYDNNSTSARATNNHQLDSIGFGMYDTLHFYESDNPNSAQELYLLAYQSEFNGEYEAAIGYYKEIVSDYKDSSSTSSCLARIFNSYEKKQATVTEYALLENYFLAIAADTSNSIIMRNISEDLAIQSNIKQGNIEEAISDYDEIYANNTNTPKGFHALINKEILAAGSGDNLSSGNSFEEIEFKQIKINALLKGFNAKDENAVMPTKLIPQNFNLSQNYPNPFNPATTFNYDLPNDGIVTIKVYDILGREMTTLVNEMKTAGYHKVQFNAADFASGAYFYQMKSGEFVAVKKFVVLK